MEPMSHSMESSVGPLAAKQLDERSAISRPIRQIGFSQGGPGMAERVKSRLQAHGPIISRRSFRSWARTAGYSCIAPLCASPSTSGKFARPCVMSQRVVRAASRSVAGMRISKLTANA
jgi:hypothetical protein